MVFAGRVATGLISGELETTGAADRTDVTVATGAGVVGGGATFRADCSHKDGIWVPGNLTGPLASIPLIGVKAGPR